MSKSAEKVNLRANRGAQMFWMAIPLIYWVPFKFDFESQIYKNINFLANF